MSAQATCCSPMHTHVRAMLLSSVGEISCTSLRTKRRHAGSAHSKSASTWRQVLEPRLGGRVCEGWELGQGVGSGCNRRGQRPLKERLHVAAGGGTLPSAWALAPACTAAAAHQHC